MKKRKEGEGMEIGGGGDDRGDEQGMFVSVCSLLLNHNIGFSWECVCVCVCAHVLQVRSSLFHNPLSFTILVITFVEVFCCAETHRAVLVIFRLQETI